MIQKKTCRMLYELNEDSRVTTKRLGKTLKISQQGASYLVNKSIEKGIISSHVAVFDSARFGLINILVVYNFRNLKSAKIKEFIDDLRQITSTTMITTLLTGNDMIVGYTVPNLSFFNKFHEVLLNKHNDNVVPKDFFVTIVKHVFPRGYLINFKDDSEIVISGDRKVKVFSEREKSIIKLLRENPKITNKEICEKTGLSIKTIISTIKAMGEAGILRKFSINLDHPKLNLKSRYIFLSTDLADLSNIKRLIEYCKLHKNIVEASKIIGHYNLLLKVEEIDTSTPILNSIRREFDINDFKVVYIDEVLLNETIPIDPFMDMIEAS